MYLLVFVFLMLSIIGLYTEIYALQLSHFFARQKSIGQTMLTWHGGAVFYARTAANGIIADTNANSPSGCLLTQSPQIALQPSAIGCATTLAFNNTTYLPVGYASEYRWYTIVYRPTGSAQQLIMTFAPPSIAGNPASTLSHPRIGYTPSEVLQQIRNSRAPNTSYGMVINSRLVAVDAPENPKPAYEIPVCNCVPDGSVGFVSPL